ncbi:Nucleolar protein 13 [Ceratocystis platani]|uniref:Nucleolar protein 13 n=1 Tax=Ceratocystis fimbriata f. sp. platani TaxID=88771 RepID=A0A0F8DP09_CERFI|nr:Nucleolar protein 13 [Ceratocystis platani]
MGKRVRMTEEAAAAAKQELEAAVANAETPVKKSKKNKSDKKNSKTSSQDTDEAKIKDEIATTTEAPAASSTPPTDAEVTSSKKRKADLEEIQVDLTLPEPPSKKAKRLMKKGKDPAALSKVKKKAAASDEDLLDVGPGDDEDADKNGDKKQSAKRPRSEHCVWVGNLPFQVTTTELRKWLVDNSGGVILEDSITRVKMPSSKEHKLPNGQSQNKGFAYVDFDTLGAKVAAIALSENSIGTRKLLIKDSTSFEGRPKPAADATAVTGANADQMAAKETKPQTKSERNACKKIYVGNMPFTATEDDLYTLFEKCGEIDWVKVANFEDSGKCKGYGWVKFKEPTAAASAVKGWVRIPQTEDNPEDFQTEEEKAAIAAAEAKSEGGQTTEVKSKKPAMRKWHVSRLKGRDLKVELAEDDKKRYDKRFGRNSKTAQAQKQDRYAAKTAAAISPAVAMEVDA